MNKKRLFLLWILLWVFSIILTVIITIFATHIEDKNLNKLQNKNLYSFEKEFKEKNNNLNTFYKEHIDNGLLELKNIPFDNDFCKKFIIKADKEYNLYSETFKKLYYDYIERKYRSLYSTPYKYLIVYKSPYTDNFYISFYYDKNTIDK